MSADPAHRSIREVDRVAPAISGQLRWSGCLT